VWIFADSDTMLAAHGSSNPTEPGLLFNFETVSVERSWVETVKTALFAELFKEVWEGRDPNTLTIMMPEGLTFLKSGKTNAADCPTIDDFWAAWHEDARKGLAAPLPVNVQMPPSAALKTRL
jgi:hypothetical protein